MKGVKDSLVTLSAVGAAGLLAYYSLSAPNAAIESGRSISKRSYDAIDDSLDFDGASGYLSEFCYEDAECADDVLMFAEEEELSELEMLRRRKKGGKGPAKQTENSDTQAAAVAWLASAEGIAAVEKKNKASLASVNRMHNSMPPVQLAQIPVDAPRFGYDSTAMTSSTADVFSAIAENGADCSFGENDRTSNTNYVIMFPEDAMVSTDTDQSNLFDSYKAFTQAMVRYTSSDNVSVGKYQATGKVLLEPYGSDTFSNDGSLGFGYLKAAAKANRKGAHTVAISQPKLSTVFANTNRLLAQKKIQRADQIGTPGGNSCQLILVMHQMTQEYKHIISQDSSKWEMNSSLRGKCNVIPVYLHDSDSGAEMGHNMVANLMGSYFQDKTMVEPNLRGYVLTSTNDWMTNVNSIADGMVSQGCMSEQRCGCMVARDHWEPAAEAAERELTTAAETTTTEWTSTSEYTTTIETTEDWTTSAQSTGMETPKDTRCCSGMPEAGGLGGSTYNAAEELCCKQDGVFQICN